MSIPRTRNNAAADKNADDTQQQGSQTKHHYVVGIIMLGSLMAQGEFMIHCDLYPREYL
jgi:hypothetical protein